MALCAARSTWLRDRIREAKAAAEEDHKQQQKDKQDKGATSSSLPLTMLSVVLPEADPRAFELVLDYIYTDQIDPTRNNRELAASNEVVLTMMQVYTLAVTFHMKRLEELCAQYVENSISLSNVLVALDNASRLKLLFIKEYCQKFITKEQNYNSIVFTKEFEELDQPLMVEIIRKRQCPQPSSQAGSSLRAGGGAGGGAGGAVSPDQHRPPPHHQHQHHLDESHTLRDDMRRFLLGDEGAEFADVRLSLGEKVSAAEDGDGDVFPSHRAVLAARSSYFEGKFRSFGPTSADSAVHIAIGELVPSRQSFQSLLRYVYYGDVTMPPEDSLYLFSASQFYIFSNQRLQVFCKNNLERNVTVENVLPILEAADRSHVHDMKRFALRLIVLHFSKVARLPRIRALPKELLLEIIQERGRADERRTEDGRIGVQDVSE